MALPNIKVKVNGEIVVNLALRSNATKKTVKELLDLHNEHKGCGGRISQELKCSKCGESKPETISVTGDGLTYTREVAEAGVFEVVGMVKAQEVNYSWTENTYFAEAKNDALLTGAIVEAMKTLGVGWIGYMRMQENSDERPAVLIPAEDGVLVVHTLYYADTEATAGITLFEKSDKKSVKQLNKLSSKLKLVSPSSLVRREVEVARTKLSPPEKVRKTKSRSKHA